MRGLIFKGTVVIINFPFSDRYNLENAELKFTTTYSFGLNTDIKLARNKKASTSEEGYRFLRLRYAYNLPRFSKKYERAIGNLHYITIGIGGFGRTIKRQY